MNVLSSMGHKRRRRTKAEMDSIREAMVRLCRESRPLTVRQLFYLLVSACLIEKLESEYKRTVVRLALALRKFGEIPWDWVVDRTRWYFKPTTYSTLEEALEATARAYRRAVWDDSPVNVQVWCESMSAAGVVRNHITRHIDPDAYRRLMAVEEAERETLASIAGQHRGRGGR